MADIDINAGLALKADVNKLYADVAGAIIKFKSNRKFDEKAYTELLDEYSSTVTELEKIRDELNDLLEEAQSNKLPDENDIKAMDAIAGLMGAKNSDGSLNFKKLMALGETFKPSDKKDK